MSKMKEKTKEEKKKERSDPKQKLVDGRREQAAKSLKNDKDGSYASKNPFAVLTQVPQEFTKIGDLNSMKFPLQVDERFKNNIDQKTKFFWRRFMSILLIYHEKNKRRPQTPSPFTNIWLLTVPF